MALLSNKEAKLEHTLFEPGNQLETGTDILDRFLLLDSTVIILRYRAQKNSDISNPGTDVLIFVYKNGKDNTLFELYLKQYESFVLAFINLPVGSPLAGQKVEGVWGVEKVEYVVEEEEVEEEVEEEAAEEVEEVVEEVVEEAIRV
ncbi:hypothetical protein DL98DRAFT_538606 [Cadophora sp. DSE1049]|nr:hypothetical protein DL98DRAFT_538606 [Cadophora sp. DSE1049]